MDAFLTREAVREIKALSLTLGGKTQDGLLIGHGRGPRVFIEKIWPTECGFFSQTRKYWQLHEIFGGRIIGFFSYVPGPERRKKILQPLACGKVLLEIFPKKKGGLSFRSFLVTFDGCFHLSPCPLEIEAKRG